MLHAQAIRSGKSSHHETRSSQCAAIVAAIWTVPAVSCRKVDHFELGRQLEGPDRANRRQEIQGGNRRRCRVHHRRNHRPAQQGEARERQPGKRHHLHDVACRLALCHRRPLRDARSRQDSECQKPRAAGQDQPVSTSARGPMSTPSAIAPIIVPAGIKFECWADLWKPGAERQDLGARLRRQPSRRRRGQARRRRRGDLGKGPGQTQGAQAELQGLLCQ